ncbi:hypothetical protein WBQ88_19270 [Sphingopyxis sp. CCNWLW253]|uniref:hypothetical protein n=1 Tax=unclassified Sphingopyxis TaxID=2614943 RepID=UPI003012EA18
MTLPPIEPYVESFFWQTSSWKKDIPAGYVRRTAIVEWISERITVSVERFGPEVCRPYLGLASDIFDRMIESGNVAIQHHPVAGEYYCVDSEKLTKFRAQTLQNDETTKQYQTVGAHLFDDIFGAYSRESDLSAIENVESSLKIPASDRVVHLNDNERKAIDETAQQLASSLKKENSVDGDVDLRDRFVAQLAAARELVRADSVRAYLMYETLVRMLGMLIQKYQGHVIGAAAQKLLDLVIQHIFGK